MERKLASIQVVKDIRPIVGADNIEVADVLGWSCVVKKGEFQVGQKAIYFEIDSILDKTNPTFEFMAQRKFRVRTIKLLKTISQGLLLPLSCFPELKLEKLKEGDDVTELTKTTKYDPELTKEQSFMPVKKNRNLMIEFMLQFSLFRKIYYWIKPHVPQSFPSDYVSKTDQPRLQSEPYKLEKYAQNLCYATEKLDGCSATYVISKNKSKIPFSSKYDYAVCSRNYRVDKNGGTHWAEMSKKYDIELKLIDLFESIKKGTIPSFGVIDIESLESIAIQGEIIGQGIQKNKYKKTEKELRVFGIIIQTKKNRYRLNQININKICSIYDLQTVNEVDLFKGCTLPKVDFIGKNIQDWVDKSIFKTQEKTSDSWAEGIVVSVLENTTGHIKDSFKVINPQFLLKYEGEEPEI
ncbi:MAG: RNA ligase family protein [Endomicrobiaceae bacterium]